MAMFHDHDIGRVVEFDIGGNCTPWLRIWSGGLYGFRSPAWVDRPLGGEWSGEPGTCEIVPFRGWGASGSNIYLLACKGLASDQKWGIVVNWDGHVVNEWVQGWGSFARIGERPAQGTPAHATPLDESVKTYAEPELSWEEYEAKIEHHGAEE